MGLTRHGDRVRSWTAFLVFPGFLAIGMAQMAQASELPPDPEGSVSAPETLNAPNDPSAVLKSEAAKPSLGVVEDASAGGRVPQSDGDGEKEGPELELSGFVDVVAVSESETNRFLQLGDVELDLEFALGKNYATSVALVWNEEGAEIAVAVLDYHFFGDGAPTRGPIFEELGFHIQVGRFDLPFGIDYELFAAPDRLNITAPLTTELIQMGGFNGDGGRLYGTWDNFTYALYFTNSIYRDGGFSFGSRVSYLPGRDPFRMHETDNPLSCELGVSYLGDMNVKQRFREHNVAADLSLQLWWAELRSEVLWHQSPEIGGTTDPWELAYYANLSVDFSEVLDWPVLIFVRFDHWHPFFESMENEDGESVPAEPIRRVSAAVAVEINEYFKAKLEYFDHFEDQVGSFGLPQRLVMFQLVAGF